MEIDESDASNCIFDFVNWTLETGVWNGRPVSWKEASSFRDEVEMRLFSLLFQNQDCFGGARTCSHFAAIGSNEYRHALLRDFQPLGFSKSHLILQAGFEKDLSKFWEKHQQEILIGIGIVATLTVVLVIAVSTAGTKTGAAAALGSVALISASNSPSDGLLKLQSTKPQPLAAPIHSSSIGQLVFNKTGIFFDHRYTSYDDILQNPIMPFYDPLRQISKEKEFEVLPVSLQPMMPEKKSWMNTFFDTIGRHVIDSPDLFENVPPPRYEFSESFVSPGKRDPWIGISSIHGMATSQHEALDHASHLAQFSKGYAIDWVYNNTHGFIMDFLEIVLLNLQGSSPKTSDCLAKNWMDFHQINKDRPNAKFLQFCFSQGSIHVRNALQRMPKEVRDRVIVVAFASPVIIPQSLCYQAKHYACKGDRIPYGEELFVFVTGEEGERMQIVKDREEVLMWIDKESQEDPHSFQNPAFDRIKKSVIDEYLKEHGEYQ